MKLLRGALIGCGFFSRHHQEAWRRTPGVALVAACDRVIERAQAAAPHAYTSVEEMLQSEQLDFVDIATRSETHLPVVTLAAERGLAIICQKPLAPDWPTACRLVEVAEHHRVRLMVHDNWRWQSWYRAAAALIGQGAIGTPLAYGFRCRISHGLGTEPYPKQSYFRDLQRFLIDEALVHHLDVARFLFGDIATVYAEGATRNPVIKGEDHVILTLRHINHAMGWVDGHTFLDHDDSQPGLDETTIEGDEGSLRINRQGEVWSGEERLWQDPGEGYRGDSVYATQLHFVHCLQTRNPFETAGRDYLESTFAAVEAAYASLLTHRAVPLSEIRQR